MVKGSDCMTGKRQYADAATARASARAGRKGGQGTSTLRAYRCKWCDCWHIGNQRAGNSKSRHTHRPE